MKPFQELEYRGRIRRLRKQAQAALEAYGLAEASLKFLSYSGNTNYQVDTSRCASPEADDGRYWANHYILRLHQPTYQAFDAIHSELLWLQALLRDTDIIVSEPISNSKGEFVTKTDVPGLPTPQHASLLRWVKGRKTPKKIRNHHYRALWRVAAKLHNHSTHWQPPKGFTRIHYDWDGLFSDAGLFEIPVNKIWEAIPERYQKPFEQVTDQVQNVMKELGKSSDVYGLIHADLCLDVNMLWYCGEMRPIDFDDAAYGYWIYDLAISLVEVQDDETRYRLQNALLDGYTEIRPMPSTQWKYLDLFIGVWHATAMLYAINAWLANPRFREGSERWRDQEGDYLVQTLARI
jgi:Ser/Thr protein kinase RdoA (MazF antagonist)